MGAPGFVNFDLLSLLRSVSLEAAQHTFPPLTQRRGGGAILNRLVKGPRRFGSWLSICSAPKLSSLASHKFSLPQILASHKLYGLPESRRNVKPFMPGRYRGLQIRLRFIPSVTKGYRNPATRVGVDHASQPPVATYFSSGRHDRSGGSQPSRIVAQPRGCGQQRSSEELHSPLRYGWGGPARLALVGLNPDQRAGATMSTATLI